MTRLPAWPQTSSLASVSEHLLPPLCERRTPYLWLGRTAPLTPAGVGEFKCQCVCLSGWMVPFLLKLRNTWLPSPHTLLYLLCLILHTSNPQTQLGARGHQQPAGRLTEWAKSPGCSIQTVQTACYNRINRSQLVLVFQDQGQQHQAQDKILNTLY